MTRLTFQNNLENLFMAKFTKGNSGNPNGRPKGKVNRTTEELRNLIQAFVEANINKLQKDFDSLAPKERIGCLEKFLRHVLPPPLDLFDKLTDEQIDQIIEKLKKE